MNPNDIENKNKIINNFNICFENEKIYIYNKKNLIDYVNRYHDKHKKLEIDKDKLLEYLNSLIQQEIYDKLINEYEVLIKINDNNLINKFDILMTTLTIDIPIMKNYLNQSGNILIHFLKIFIKF